MSYSTGVPFEQIAKHLSVLLILDFVARRRVSACRREWTGVARCPRSRLRSRASPRTRFPFSWPMSAMCRTTPPRPQVSIAYASARAEPVQNTFKQGPAGERLGQGDERRAEGARFLRQVRSITSHWFAPFEVVCAYMGNTCFSLLDTPVYYSITACECRMMHSS